MLTAKELQRILDHLHLSQREAAQLLGVADRTVRRWLEGDELPGPAEQALRAWLRLSEMQMPWRPDSTAIRADDQKQIAAHRLHSIALSELLARVEARGGPRVPWEVEWNESRARLGPMEVTFYKLRNGGFSLSAYTRKDKDPDARRDWEQIEDAAYCIAQELRGSAVMQKMDPGFGPVNLTYHDGPMVRPASGLGRLSMLQIEELPTVDAAFRRAAELSATSKLYMPRIEDRETEEQIFNTIEILDELGSLSTSYSVGHASSDTVATSARPSKK